ncbi:MAG: hypothetical protein IT428_32280 [Planctomycetaceae bacterium]|nr:hypothetical protein [Planctomycetaceae bacterium]
MSDAPRIYRETSERTRRRFELFADRIVVHFKSIHSDGETTIRLDELNPESDRIRVRPLKPIRISFFILFIGVLGLIASYVRPELNRHYNLGVQSLVLVFAPLFLLIKFGAKVEYVRFKTKAGVVVLDVGRSGPDKRQFDSFVTELRDRISACQTKDLE